MKTRNKYIYLYIVQGNYSFGWEDLTASESYRECKADIKAYRDNEGGAFRIIERRELNENN